MTESKDWPEYECHKRVQAAKIVMIEALHNGDRRVSFESGHIRMSAAWCDRHQPHPGGYVVRYQDGYTSYSPAKAFEEGYTVVDATGGVNLAKTFDFGLAIHVLRSGGRVARQGWNGKGMWLELQVPDEHSKMTLPYIYMKTACDNQIPWLASQTDMLATDWIKVEP